MVKIRVKVRLVKITVEVRFMVTGKTTGTIIFSMLTFGSNNRYLISCF